MICSLWGRLASEFVVAKKDPATLQTFVNTILGRLIDELRETWESVKTINFELAETESNPFLLQIVAPNEPIVLLEKEKSFDDDWFKELAEKRDMEAILTDLTEFLTEARWYKTPEREEI